MEKKQKNEMYERYIKLRREVRSNGISSLNDDDKNFFKNFWTIVDSK